MIRPRQIKRSHSNEKEEDNKAVIVRWFTEFWGKDVNLAVVDEIAERKRELIKKEAMA